METKITVKKDSFGDFYTCYAEFEDKVIVGCGLNKEICLSSFEQGVENVKKDKDNIKEG